MWGGTELHIEKKEKNIIQIEWNAFGLMCIAVSTPHTIYY